MAIVSFVFSFCREGKMENFCKFVMNMTDNVKTLITVHHDYAKKQLGREYSVSSLLLFFSSMQNLFFNAKSGVKTFRLYCSR